MTACLPSSPAIPIPILAAWIIATSFAPSPIANVMTFRFSLTTVTTSAFCAGETLQHITDLHCLPNKTNFLRTVGSSWNTIDKAAPSMINATFDFGTEWSSFASLIAFSRSSSSFKVNPKYSDKYDVIRLSMYPTSLGSSPGLTTSNFMSLPRRLQEKPMLIAVSILSPVRTQSLIPALARIDIESGTPGCNLSSIAVPPRRVKSVSNSSLSSSIIASFESSIDALASLYLSSHSKNAFSSITFCVMQSVLKPSLAKSSKCKAVLFSISSEVSGSSLLKMTLSAPFVYIVTSPVSDFKMHDILFLADVNGTMCRSS